LNHFLAPGSLTLEETQALFEVARDLRTRPLRTDLHGKSVGLLFFNPSLRTRASMDVGIWQLGGHALTMDVGVGTWKLEHREGKVMDGDYAEHIKDAAKVLSRYVDALAIRSFPERISWGEDRKDPIINAFAKWADKPVINLEGSLYHPCQSLADLMTIEDRLGSAKKQPIVITWAWHPKALPMAVPNSILVESAKFGMDVRLCHPPGWELDDEIMATARGMAAASGGSVTVHHDFEPALEGARVVYAKSWGSIANYRNPDEETRIKNGLRQKWRVRMEHMERTDDAFFMHCLPVRRGVVVDDAVLDSDRNAAYDEAENRLHVQKALMLRMLANVR
jgi:N-acetylornithine carbamoyltransferase